MIRPLNAQRSERNGSGFRLLCLSCSIVAGICVLALILPRDRDGFSDVALSDVKYFFPKQKQSHSKTSSLKSDDVVPWGYSQDDGPEHWGDLSIAYKKCKTGAAQSPIDVQSTESKGQLLTLPTLRWNGFENASSKGPTSFIKADLGKHGYRIQFVERAPTITTVDFTQYLNMIPISKVKRTTYTLDRILFKTPSENLINGKRFPCEVQFVHECSPRTQPACPATAHLVISLMLTKAPAQMESYGMASPPFLSGLVSDMRLLAQTRPHADPARADGLPPRHAYVQDDDLDFATWADAMRPFLSAYYEFKGSTTAPPCEEDATWIVLQEAAPARPEDMDFVAGQGHNVRPTQPFNGRAMFEVLSP